MTYYNLVKTLGCYLTLLLPRIDLGTPYRITNAS